MKLVDDWKNCWKWISVWCMGFTGAVSATWEWLPSDWKQVLLQDASVGVAFKIISFLSIMGIAGRLIKQGKNDGNI